MEGLTYGGKLRFKINWASLIVGRKFTVLALFYFVFEGNFPSTGPPGAYIWRGDLTEGFFALPVWRAYNFGGAYTWRGLFSEFYGSTRKFGIEQGITDGTRLLFIQITL